MGRLQKVTQVLLFGVFLGSCQPVPVQQPPGPAAATQTYPGTATPSQPMNLPPSANLPPPGAQPQPQVSGSQRTEYVWQKMMEGVAMGGAVGGPFGAGGGLIVGLIAGLLTANSYYADLSAKIQTEQTKDRELEAQIEREIERQRELEAGLAGSPPPSDPKKTEQLPQPQEPARVEKQARVDAAEKEPTAMASLKKRESASPASPFKNVEIKDLNGDGIPDLWIYRNPLKPDEMIRREEATKGDGRVDMWSYFKDGKLVRREVDKRGDGRPNTVYYYDDEKLVREERDENGDGRATYRAHYQNGRLTRTETSTRADGKIDLWVHYDTAKEGEVIIREERDLNGDGAVDLWSHYQDGRLVRRDVSAAGLEYLSKSEEAPQMAAPRDLTQGLPAK